MNFSPTCMQKLFFIKHPLFLQPSFNWAYGKGNEIGLPAKNSSVSKYKKRCQQPYNNEEKDCYGWPHPIQADEEMVRLLMFYCHLNNLIRPYFHLLVKLQNHC